MLGLTAGLKPTAGDAAPASRAWAWAGVGADRPLSGPGPQSVVSGGPVMCWSVHPAIWVSVNARLDTATAGMGGMLEGARFGR